MIYLIGEAPQSKHYEQVKFGMVMGWLYQQKGKHVQLDIETNVTQYWCTNKIITVQFGNKDGSEQWVIQWSALIGGEETALKWALQELDITWDIHNAMFECIVFLFYSVRLRKVWCTMIAEMILYTGIHTQDDQEMEDDETVNKGGFFSLAETNYRYLGYQIDKTEQMNFGDDILTESKVLYAAGDVKPLGFIRKCQMMSLTDQDLDWVGALEMEAVLGYAEMTYHGMELNTDEWLANLALALPIQAQAKADLDAMMADPGGAIPEEGYCIGLLSRER